MSSSPPPGSAAVAELELVAARARRRAARGRRGGRGRSSTSRRGTRRARASRRARPTRTPCWSIAAGRHATRPRGSMPGEAQDLRHLRDVAEHVGQVADRHRAAELGRRGAMPAWRSRTMVSPETMNSSMRHHPRPDRHPSARDEARDRVGLVRPDLEVVVEHRRSGRRAGTARTTGSRSSRSSSSSSRCTSWTRNTWNGSYHSRSQCVCGTMATGSRRHLRSIRTANTPVPVGARHR